MLMIEVLRKEDRGKFSLLSPLSSLLSSRATFGPSLNQDLLVSHLERKLLRSLLYTEAGRFKKVGSPLIRGSSWGAAL
jgi:hypothetical protein